MPAQKGKSAEGSQSVAKSSSEKRERKSSRHRSKEKASASTRAKGRRRSRRHEKEESVEQNCVPVEEALKEEEKTALKGVVTPVISRFLLMNKTFPAISRALVDERHPFSRACYAFLAKDAALATMLEEKPHKLTEFLREELWSAAKDWYQLTEESRGQVLAAEATERAVARASNTFVLPALEVEAKTLASQPQLRGPLLKAWLTESAASHKGMALPAVVAALFEGRKCS